MQLVNTADENTFRCTLVNFYRCAEAERRSTARLQSRLPVQRAIGAVLQRSPDHVPDALRGGRRREGV